MFGDKRRPQATIAAEIDRIIGLNIRRAREDVRLGQHELAGLLGVSTNILARYEEGQERTPAAVLLELTRHLGCPLTDLFAGMPSLEVEEEFQVSRPSSLPAEELTAPAATRTSNPPKRSEVEAGTVVSEAAVAPADPPPDCAVVPTRPDAAALARIIEAYSALESPIVRERLLQLLQALR